MGWRLVRVDVKRLKRKDALALAADYAAMPRSPVERPLVRPRKDKLVNALRLGRVIPFHWATAEFDGQQMRVNGQHSSSAIVEVGQDGPDELYFVLSHYECDTREDVVDVFRQHDQRWSSRSSLDIAGAHQGWVAEIRHANAKLMKVAAEAIVWCQSSVEGLEGTPKGDDAYQLIMDAAYTPFLAWLSGVYNGRRELMNRYVVAAMYATYNASQSRAAEFWRAVSFGPDHFSDDMEPGAVLISELNRSLDDPEFKNKAFPQNAFYYKKAIKAWNAFGRGQRISSLRVTKAKPGKGNGWPEVWHPSDEDNVEADAA